MHTDDLAVLHLITVSTQVGHDDAARRANRQLGIADTVRDPQLERAVQEALRQLEAKPAQRATREPPAPTWGKRVKPLP